MNTQAIESRWMRLLDAMTDAARSLAVPLMGMPIGASLGMIIRPESYSPLEIRVTATVYLVIVVTMMTVATVKQWRQPDTTRHYQALVLAQETLAKATILYEGTVALHASTTDMLLTTKEWPEPRDD